MVSDDVTAEISADASAPKAEPASAGLRRRHLKPASQADDHTQLLPKPEDSSSDTDSSSGSKTSLVGKIWRRFFSRHATPTSTKHPSRTSSFREDTSVARPARVLLPLLFERYHPMMALGVLVPIDQAKNLERIASIIKCFDVEEFIVPVVIVLAYDIGQQSFVETRGVINSRVETLEAKFDLHYTHAMLFNILAPEPVIFFTFVFPQNNGDPTSLKRAIVGFTIDAQRQSRVFVKLLGSASCEGLDYYKRLEPSDPRLVDYAARVRAGATSELILDQDDDVAIAATIYPGSWPITVQVGIIDKRTLLQKRADAGVALPEELAELAFLSAPLATAVVDTATRV
jgi:hypothetical protein